MSRYFILAVLTLSIAPVTQALDLKSELKACAATKDSLSRLVCYDKLMQDTQLLEGAEEVEVSSRQKAPAYTASTGHSVNKENEFGKKHLDYASPEDNKANMFSVIDKVRELHYGKLALTLTNGQVWHQTDSNKLMLEAGDKVELVEGMLSAIYLKKEGFNKRIRVKRIK